MTTTVVFKLGGLGDLLMATPALRAYRRSFPGERIVCIVGESNRHVLAGNPHVDELLAVDDRALFRGGRLAQARETLRLIALIRSRRAQHLFILHRDWRWNLVARLSGVSRRYGFARDARGLFLTHAAPATREEHETLKYQHVFGLRPGYRPDGVAMDLPPTLADFAAVEALWPAPEGPGAQPAPWIALSPGGAANVKEEMDTRRWPLEHFRELAELLLARTPCRLLLIGAASDVARTEALRLHPTRVLDVAGRLSATQTALALRRCAALVTHDSGPMHLGAAAGIPVLALFGPTYPAEKVPLTHPLSRALWIGARLPCSPCYHDGILPPCSHPEFKHCLVAIRPQEVFERVKEVVEGEGATAIEHE